MDIPLNELIPALDINKNVDMAILPGTPMVPNKPAIVIWYRNPLLKNSGRLCRSESQPDAFTLL